jgi:hypothetical protein
MPIRTVLQAINEALHEEMAEDERVFVLGEDVEEGGVFRATEGLLEKFGRERVMDTPWPSPASWAWPSAPPSTASCPWPRSSSPTLSCRR